MRSSRLRAARGLGRRPSGSSTTRSAPQLPSASPQPAPPLNTASVTSGRSNAAERGGAKEVLSCRIKGFYPFPRGAGGLLEWVFQDTHQAISVKTSSGSDRVLMDFMTEGGQAHPVWWDEGAKWQMWLGQDIRGEVRIRNSGLRGAPGSKMDRLRAIAASYDRSMNLYTNNCRIFCARMQREVERLNAESDESAAGDRAAADLVADGRLVLGVLGAGALPMIYPLGVFWLCWVGLKGA